MRNRVVFAMIVASFLIGLFPVFADTVIQRGIDVFTTPGNGTTFYDFADRPIPAGFFCKGSKPFSGRVAFQGLPLTTNPPGQLGSVDTIVERLDDAVFDDKGIAVTRLRFRALSLVSVSPIKTSCGAFHVYLALNGKQRTTTMSILRLEKGGGDFIAPLAVDVKMTFIPVKPARQKDARTLSLNGSVTFPATPLPWTLVPAPDKASRVISVDTNGDLVPDTPLAGVSNFLAGQSPRDAKTLYSTGRCSCCPSEFCHADSGEQHCTTIPMCPNTYSCC